MKGVKTLSKTYHINASTQECINAWTDPDSLTKWLAYHAEVDVNNFCIASRIPYISGRHKLSNCSQTQLCYDWYVEGYKTQLNLDFKRNSQGTELTLTHTFPAKTPPFLYLGYSEESLSHSEEIWHLCLLRFKSFLEGEKEQVKMDLHHNSIDVNLSIDIQTTPEILWNALIEKEQVIKWSDLMMANGHIDERLGGRYSFGWEDETDGPGKITKFSKK